MNRHVHEISQRLSLRPPQHDSLEILDAVTDRVPLRQGVDLNDALAKVQEVCKEVTDFERAFPSLCFGLATGVGKTRLMGAFIAYLHLARGVRNFFVLAPNRTIYRKLIDDFDPGRDRYVLRGIGAFAQNPPLIITGENYDTKNVARTQEGRSGQRQLGFESVHVNVFNIDKLNAVEKGESLPRIKRLREYIGDSYFNYLMALPDLVLLMDESHRYRAKRGVEVLNELKPVLGLEMTATPFVESAKGPVPFKNVAYSYPLSTAIRDGFVKKPVALTRMNFNTKNYSDDELERVKLEDAIRVHESVKVDLELYHLEQRKPRVKPFVLVVAQNVDHAERIKTLIAGESFFGGKYRDKVIRVDSTLKGEERDETVEHLLKVEDPSNPTEVVIHVNMLKEGWDVRNLYVIVPLRAANARTLVEQTVGRGLRLPFGELTGRDPLDRLTIVAHDRFDELIDEASRPDSLIQGGIMVGKDIPEKGQVIVAAPPSLGVEFIEPAPAATAGGGEGEAPTPAPTTAPQPSQLALQGMVTTPAGPPAVAVPKAEGNATLAAIRHAANQPTHFPTIEALATPEGVEAISKKVMAALSSTTFLPTEAEAVKSHVTAVVKRFVERVIGIPRVRVLPDGEVNCGVDDFDLDVSSVSYAAVDEAMLLKYLQDQSKEQKIFIVEEDFHETTLEKELVNRLVDFDDVEYFSMKDLLFKLAGQMVARLRALHGDEEMVKRVGRYNLTQMVRLIHVQLQSHFWERPTGYKTYVDGGFTFPEAASYKVSAEGGVKDFRAAVEDKSEIRQMGFTGFAKCGYPMQKFDSDTERRFAVLLEDDAEVTKWMKPARGLFTIYYRAGKDGEYEPDFVVETAEAKYLVEVKRADQTEQAEVVAKAAAGRAWCVTATDYERSQPQGKDWRYVLLPDTAVKSGFSVKYLAGVYGGAAG